MCCDRHLEIPGPHFDLYQSLNRLPIWNLQNCSLFPLAFVSGWLQGHWWDFISRNYVVWPTFLLVNVFIALKGSHFWFLFIFLPIKGNHDINKGSMSGWISSVIRLAYKDLSKKKLALLNIRADEVRALATSWAYFCKTPLEEVVRAAVWSNPSVFAKFYLRDLQKQSQNLQLLGPMVTAQKVVGGADSSSSHSC